MITPMLATARAIQVVNQLRDEGYISRYAIGGAVGALFYIEPTQTQDIDIFVHLNPEPGRLRELGHTLWEEDKVVVAGWPIRFLPAAKPIEMEAIEHAIELPLADGVKAFVPTAEYLMTIAIDLGRPKDLIRLQQFLEEKVYDPQKLESLLTNHGLVPKLERFLSLFKDQRNP